MSQLCATGMPTDSSETYKPNARRCYARRMVNGTTRPGWMHKVNFGRQKLLDRLDSSPKLNILNQDLFEFFGKLFWL